MNQLINEQRERIAHLERINDGLMSAIEKMELAAKELGYDNSMTCSELDYLVKTARAVVMVNQKNLELIGERDTLKQQNAELADRIVKLESLRDKEEARLDLITDVVNAVLNTNTKTAPIEAVAAIGDILDADRSQCLAKVKAGVLREAVELYTHKWQTNPKLANVDIEIIKKGAGFIYPAGILQFAEDIEFGIEQQGETK